MNKCFYSIYLQYQNIIIMSTIAIAIQRLEKPNFPFKPTANFYESVGMSKKRFWAIYKGKTQPRLDEMQCIAKYFGFEAKDLVLPSKNSTPTV